MELIGLLAAAVFLWVAFKSNSNDYHLIKSHSDTKLNAFQSNDAVIAKLISLEQLIIQNPDDPDSIRYNIAHIFRYLIVPWYKELISIYRNDPDKILRLNRDVSNYVDNLQRWKTLSFLSIEGEKGRRPINAEEAEKCRMSCDIFEDSIARELGAGAVKLLEAIRTARMFMFNKQGDMAPEGYEFDMFANEFRRQSPPISR